MKDALEKQRAAVAIQRAAARKQAETAGARLTDWRAIPPAAAHDCDPIAEPALTPLIESAAKTHNLEPRLVRAVMEQESGFRPCAVSRKGAEGLMQLMPETSEQLGVQDPFDIKENIEAGSKYLKDLLDRYKGDVKQALGAYNAGSTAADRPEGISDIPETREYVDAILKKLGN